MRESTQEVAGISKCSAVEMQDLRRRCIRLLIALSKSSDELPPSLFISEGLDTPPGRDPVKSGGFADIFKGVYLGREAAFKRMRIFITGANPITARKTLLQETLFWRQANHPSILPFYGVWRDYPAMESMPYLILPWISHGDAHNFCQTRAILPAVINRLLIQVAEGLEYLHAEGMIHGDLTGSNVLIDERDGQHHARLCDFGLTSLFTNSTSFLQTANHSTATGGAPRWMARELFWPTLSDPTFASDIYAFGCVALELYSGLEPFHGIHAFQVPQVISAGQLPQNPGGGQYGRFIPAQLWESIGDCWKANPEDRPNATAVLTVLRQL
ncbi:hypothetical protein JAAARDRAFT_200433 [Jaapia argillacea MUCL 33604]|uniref:Protein kinase domain-containing protein n=1 Tax=Jaapia argillacea MUCL 33604 TaxID=933084 RepID=A0A067P4W9_9AGAM|nr:hypothetical protein JAAARDRAFT_200433 [Jaapia argillacea MUCL 33604]